MDTTQQISIQYLRKMLQNWEAKRRTAASETEKMRTIGMKSRRKMRRWMQRRYYSVKLRRNGGLLLKQTGMRIKQISTEKTGKELTHSTLLRLQWIKISGTEGSKLCGMNRWPPACAHFFNLKLRPWTPVGSIQTSSNSWD